MRTECGLVGCIPPPPTVKGDTIVKGIIIEQEATRVLTIITSMIPTNHPAQEPAQESVKQ